VIRHLDLFSGIGGFALAARATGIVETVGFCEIDPFNRRTLARHWPGVPQHDDITTLTGDALSRFGRIDFITGGFPCQPFSYAGVRRGAADDRHLWPHLRRVLDEARPSVFLGENVVGLVTLGFDTVAADLEADGYAWGAVIVPAAAVNALHRRDRIWIMAHADRDERGAPGHPHGQVGAIGAVVSSGDQQAVAHADGQRREEHQRAAVAVCAQQPGSPDGRQAVADATGIAQRATDLQAGTESRERHAREDPAIGGVGGARGHRRIAQAARALDSGPDGFPVRLVRRPATGPAGIELIRQAWADGSWELDLPRVIEHEPERRQKLIAAGNAIVPQVALEIMRAMFGLEGSA
jgi:site-specific DNA-cytosine methylase